MRGGNNYGFTRLPQPYDAFQTRHEPQGAAASYRDFKAGHHADTQAEQEAYLKSLAAPDAGLSYKIGHTVKPHTFVRSVPVENVHIHHAEPNGPNELCGREFRLLHSKFRTRYTFGPRGSGL